MINKSEKSFSTISRLCNKSLTLGFKDKCVFQWESYRSNKIRRTQNERLIIANQNFMIEKLFELVKSSSGG